MSDAIGQPISIAETRHERAGSSIALTLDANIQQRAEDVLSAVGRVFHPKDSTAIVMDPRTGAILAMANWPLVNSNDPPAKPEEAFENRAVSFNYEPGSTFKVGDRLRGSAGRADHAEHAALKSPIRSNSAGARSTTTPNTKPSL